MHQRRVIMIVLSLIYLVVSALRNQIIWVDRKCDVSYFQVQAVTWNPCRPHVLLSGSFDHSIVMVMNSPVIFCYSSNVIFLYTQKNNVIFYTNLLELFILCELLDWTTQDVNLLQYQVFLGKDWGREGGMNGEGIGAVHSIFEERVCPEWGR